MKRGFVFLTVLAVAATLLTGCAIPRASSPTPGPTTQPSGPGIGTIEVRVTDALPEYIIEAVNVSFSKVEVHRAADELDGEGDWITLTITGGTFGNDGSFDLKALGDAGKVELLASDGVLAGWYTQIRVTISQVDVTLSDPENLDDGEPPPVHAELPSGKLKFVRPFRVIDGGTTTIDLDFDLDKSLVFAGPPKYNKETGEDELKVIVKPVVKLVITQGADTTPPAQVAGLTVTTVSDSELRLDWDASLVPDWNHYHVYRSETTPDTYILIADDVVGTGDDKVTYLDNNNGVGLDAGTTYYYKVSAVDTSGNEGLASEEAFGTTSSTS